GLARHSVLAKLVLARWHARLMRRLHEDALDPRSEAVAVSAGIVQAMRADAAARGARFLLVLLPSEIDLGRLRRRAGYREQWRAIAAVVARDGVACVDLADALVAAPAARPPRRRDRALRLRDGPRDRGCADGAGTPCPSRRRGGRSARAPCLLQVHELPRRTGVAALRCVAPAARVRHRAAARHLVLH